MAACKQCGAPEGQGHKMSCSEPGGRKGPGPVRPVGSISPGDLVTWGSGDIAARVDALEGTNASVTLVKDVRSPCGRVWPAGKSLTLPLVEVRPLQ